MEKTVGRQRKSCLWEKGFGGLVSGETQQAVMMIGFRNLSKQRDQDSGIDKGLAQFRGENGGFV